MELTTLRSDARRLVSPQLTSTEYPDATLDASLNHWYRRVLGWILTTGGDWEIRGDVIYKDFQAGVTVYELPSILRVFKGEVMYEVGGSFVPLNFISVQRNQGYVEGNDTRVDDDKNKPTADLMGDYIEIKPCIETGGTNVVNGIKLWVQSDFVTLDATNDVPDLMEPIQRVLSIGAAYDYALSEEMYKKKDELAKIIFGDQSKPNSTDTGIKGEIEKLYSMRSGAHRDRLSSKRFNYR